MSTLLLPSRLRGPAPSPSASVNQSLSIAQGLVGYWPMLESRGSVLHDYSGHGNHATKDNASAGDMTWTSGRHGTAARFANGDVDAGNIPAVGGANGLTVTAWCRFADTTGGTGGEGVFSKYGTGKVFLLWQASGSNGVVRFRVYNESAGYATSASWVPDTDWHFLTGCYDGAAVRLYVDGAQIGEDVSLTGSVETRTEPVRVGRYNDFATGSNDLEGDLQNAGVWARGISASEVRTLYSDPWALFRGSHTTTVYIGSGQDDEEATTELIPASMPLPARLRGPAPSPSAQISKSNSLADGLVGYWPMLEGRGETLRDYSGHGNHGTLTNMDPATDWVAGKHGKCLDFDGIDDYVDISNPVAPPQFSAVALVRVDSIGSAYAAILETASANKGWTIGCRSGNSKFELNIWDTAWRTSLSDDVITLGQWYVVCGTYDGTTARQYVDGVLQQDTETVTAIDYTGATTKIGQYSSNNFSGVVGSVHIFDRCLTPSEIATLYADPWTLFRGSNTTTTVYLADTEEEETTAELLPAAMPLPARLRGPAPSPSVQINRQSSLADGLVGYWPMLEGRGETLHDYSGHGNHGTLTNMDPATDWVAGKHGKCLEFDSTVNQMVECEVSDSLAPTAQLTVAAWFSLQNPGGQPEDLGGLVWGPHDHVNSSYILTARSDNQVDFHVREGDSWTYVTTDSAFGFNEWHYYCGTWDGATIRIYMDGVLQSGTESFSSFNYDTPDEGLWIGRYGADRVADGYICGVSVHNRCLAVQEVRTLYSDPWALFRGSHTTAIPIDTGYRYWVGSTTSWDDADNWSMRSNGPGGASVPTVEHDVVFDNSAIQDCTCDVAISCKSLTIKSTYSGTLDFADSAYSHSIAGDATFDGSGTVDCGDATITCSGNWDTLDQGAWIDGTSTVVLSGTSKTLTGNDSTSTQLFNLTITGTITQSAATQIGISVGGKMAISGTYTVGGNSEKITLTRSADASVVELEIQSGGELAGTGAVVTFSQDAVIDVQVGGTFSLVGDHACNRGGTFATAATLTGNWQLRNGFTTARTLELPSGTTTFTGNVVFETDSADGLTVDCATNNASLAFQNDVTVQEDTGSITWSKGTGTITFSGTADQTITTPSGWTDRLEDLTINKTGGRVTLAGDLYTDTLTVTDGDLDIDGNTIDSAGSVEIDGSTGARLWNGIDEDQSNGKIVVGAGTLTLTGSA